MVEPYCGVAPQPSELLTRWNFDPFLVLPLVGAAALHLGSCQSKREMAAAAVAWSLMALLFVSPLCALTSALFSARVAHHTVLVAVIAPLLVLSMPRSWRQAKSIAITAPLAFVAQLVLLWLWHAPAPYAAALADTRIFWLMELSLLGSAVWLWLAVLSPKAKLGMVQSVLLGSVVQMGLLGAVITFARHPLYLPHVGVTEPWGLSALQDQQLAGLIMWVPGSIPFLAAALMLLADRISRTGMSGDVAR